MYRLYCPMTGASCSRAQEFLRVVSTSSGHAATLCTRAQPTRFSESTAYRYGRKTVPAPSLDKPTSAGSGLTNNTMTGPDGKRMLYHKDYGWVPDMGDWYNTQQFMTIRKITVLSSLLVFMIWFCVLREENDVDFELGRPLYTRVPAMEVKWLQEKIALDKHNGLDTTKSEQRLAGLKERALHMTKEWKKMRGMAAEKTGKEE